jgi:DNA-binding FadR family transcriptional regulator
VSEPFTELDLSSSIGERRERTDKIAEKVARRILRDIVARNLEPGAKLPSEALMLGRYEVGRASLREGLRILEVYGLIWIKPGPGGGPIVADVSSIDFGRSATFFYHAVGATLWELVESRVHIEALMARLAAERPSDESAATLRECLEREGAALAAETPPVVSPLFMFHQTVAGMTGNRVLSMLGQSILDIHAERIRPVAVVDRAHVHSTHKEIGAAILSGEAEAAERLMRKHIEEMAAAFSKNFAGLVDEIIDWR